MPEQQQPPRVEPPASPEKSIQRYMTPPRARILKSVAFQDTGALHPDIPTSSFDQSHLTEGLANKDHVLRFEPLALLSSESRNKHYETDNRGFDQQYQSWEQKTQRWINWAYANNSDFRESLADLGIDNTNQEAAKLLYETYLENVPEGASVEERIHLTKRESDKQIGTGLLNFSDRLLEASQKDGVVDMAEVDRRLAALRPLLNAFGTADEVAERVRDYVTANALLEQEDYGAVAKAVMERMDSKMSIDDENSMRALARHAGVSPGSLGREPNEDRQRSRMAEGVAAAAGAVAGAALAERGEENDNDEAPVAPIEPPTEAKTTGEIDGDPTPGEPEPAPQSPSEEEKPPIDPGEEFLNNTEPLTEEELQVALDYFVNTTKDVRDKEVRDTISRSFIDNPLGTNIVRELANLLHDEGAKETLETAAKGANSKIQSQVEKLGILDDDIRSLFSNEAWYYRSVAREKFFADHHEVKQHIFGEDVFQSDDPTAYYLNQDLSRDSQEWQESEAADWDILYQRFGEVIRHQRGNKEPGEYAQEILSKLNDTLSEEERGDIEEILGFPASSVSPNAYKDLGSIIWENLAEESGTPKDDGESGGGVDLQREEAASEGALSNDAEETTREDVATDGASGDVDQGTDGDVVESETPANPEDGEEAVKTIDVSTTDTDNDADVVNNGGDEQVTSEEQEAPEDGDGTPPQTPPPPVIRQ